MPLLKSSSKMKSFMPFYIFTFCLILFFTQFMPPMHWTIGLFHEVIHYQALLFTITGIIFFLFLSRFYKGLGVILLCFSLASWTSITHRIHTDFSLDKGHIENKEKSLKVISFNLWGRNKNANSAYQWVKQQKADIFFAQEAHYFWRQQFKKRKWKKLFPYQIKRAQTTILSRYPLNNCYSLQSGHPPYPWISCQIYWNRKRISLLSVHFIRPLGRKYFNVRNKQFKIIQKWIKKQKKPYVIAGDFNTGNWSYFMKKFKQSNNLTENLSHIFSSSWPSKIPFLGLQIDHILSSSNTIQFDSQIGPHLGSDHRPVSVKINLNKTLK